MSRNSEVDRETPEEHLAPYQRESNHQEDTAKNDTQQRNLGTVAYNIECKCEKPG
jgi:hypothetical protein